MSNHPTELRNQLRESNLTLSKGLGQNFLFDEDSLIRIADAAEILPSDTVLEIGTGIGSLTYYLAARAKEVITIEIDRKLMPLLQKTFAGVEHIRLIQGDILEQDMDGLVPGGFIVAANIPYYITSAVLRHILSGTNKPRRIVLLVQKEVAERICAHVPDMSLLAVSVQLFGNPRMMGTIKAGAFTPPPKVDSAILRIDIYQQPLLEDHLIEPLFQLARAGFQQKRKMLRNSLAAGLGRSGGEIKQLLLDAEITPDRRAETLSIADWIRLASVISTADRT